MKLLKTYSFLLFALLAITLVVFSGCKPDEPEPADALKLTALVANGTDLMSGTATEVNLNAAAAAANVPLDAIMKATFDASLDAASASTSNVKLSEGSNDVAIAVSATGSSITITPAEDLRRGIVYTLNFASGIKSSDGGALTAVSRTFTAAGRADVVPPNNANQKAYWQFNGNAQSIVGSFDGTETSITYGTDRLGNLESAAVFDGDVSIIEVPNASGLMTNSWTLSYWMQVDSNGHKNADGGNAGHFVMGLGDVFGFFIEVQGGLGGMKFTGRYEKSGGTSTANDFFFNGDGQDGMNGGWVGIEFEKDLTASGGLGGIVDNKWTHMVITHDGPNNKRSMYMNGVLMQTDNFNNTTDLNTVKGLTFDDTDKGIDVIGKALAFGYNHDIETTHWDNEPWGGYDLTTSNHFKGMLDDVRIFDAAFGDSDAKALYDAEK